MPRACHVLGAGGGERVTKVEFIVRIVLLQLDRRRGVVLHLEVVVESLCHVAVLVLALALREAWGSLLWIAAGKA